MVTPCLADGPYGVSGCAPIVCTQPTDMAGYTATNTELDTSAAAGFTVVPLCDAGYDGTPAVAACTTSGPYVLSGCAAIVCTTPTTVGYTFSAEQLDLGTGGAFAVTVACGANYETTDSGPAAAACTASGVYTVTG